MPLLLDGSVSRSEGYDGVVVTWFEVERSADVAAIVGVEFGAVGMWIDISIASLERSVG